MSAGLDLARVAALVGDTGRANMLSALMDGRAHTASELANIASIASSTASGHLAKLKQGNLVRVLVQGRHRYFRLISPEVAHMLEGMMVVSAGLSVPQRRAAPRVDPALRRARSCYDHLAGELGVAVADALITKGAVAMVDETATITPAGYDLLAKLQVVLDDETQSRRPICRACLDWTERRPHLAGKLGSALLDRALAVGWVKRQPSTRTLLVNANAGRAFAAALGVQA